MKKAAFFSDSTVTSEIEFMHRSERASILERVYPSDRMKRIAQNCDLFPTVIHSDNFEACLPDLGNLEIIFSTWGMPPLTTRQIKKLPNLKILFYAAGSVQRFAAPFLENGIRIVSAGAANSVPVAEFTQAQIILANKGYFRNIREYTSPSTLSTAFRGPGNFRTTVALLGAGMIGRNVIELLKPFDLRILVFDPFLSGADAAALHVEKVELMDAFKQAQVVSNHLADNPQTRGLLREEHFSAMQPNAVFINTGRGATVNEEGMVHALKERTDLTALLDVSHPEPPEEQAPVFQLPNIQISSHIAGSINHEIPRMADLVISEFENWCAGKPLAHEIVPAKLATMA
ncbi:hydroxyacid dehydrogenase [Pontiellaceae bacterium B12219]|nr:hydroxyacid dehydrogenase [Pontiellaceae bacterium B12219]